LKFYIIIVVELEEIEILAKKMPIEEVLKNFKWKEFEEIVAEIFRAHGFVVKKNFRFKAERRYEIDVLAVRNNLIFCVDCKRWSGGRYKKSRIKMCVAEQEKRVEALKSLLNKEKTLKDCLKVGENFEIKPLLITLMEEDLREEKNTLIVPIFKLNSFLIEAECYF